MLIAQRQEEIDDLSRRAEVSPRAEYGNVSASRCNACDEKLLRVHDVLAADKALLAAVLRVAVPGLGVADTRELELALEKVVTVDPQLSEIVSYLPSLLEQARG